MIACIYVDINIEIMSVVIIIIMYYYYESLRKKSEIRTNIFFIIYYVNMTKGKQTTRAQLQGEAVKKRCIFLYCICCWLDFYLHLLLMT